MRNRDYVMLLVLAVIITAIGVLAIGTKGHPAEKCQTVLVFNDKFWTPIETCEEMKR